MYLFLICDPDCKIILLRLGISSTTYSCEIHKTTIKKNPFRKEGFDPTRNMDIY